MPWRKINVTHYKEKKTTLRVIQLRGADSQAFHNVKLGCRSKGYLVFDRAEALTAIDVNSGRSRREDKP